MYDSSSFFFKEYCSVNPAHWSIWVLPVIRLQILPTRLSNWFSLCIYSSACYFFINLVLLKTYRQLSIRIIYFYAIVVWVCISITMIISLCCGQGIAKAVMSNRTIITSALASAAWGWLTTWAVWAAIRHLVLWHEGSPCNFIYVKCRARCWVWCHA